MNLHGKITKNYSWEIDLFQKWNMFSEEIDIVDFNIIWKRWYCDHNPQLNFYIRLFNFTVFDFTIYNIWHVDRSESPFYERYKKELREEYDTLKREGKL